MMISRKAFGRIAGAALLAAMALPAHAETMAAPSEDELARWTAALSEIKAMSPTWGVQGAEAFKASADAGVPVFFLDVRTPEEWEGGHVEGATHVPLTTLPTAEGMAKLPQNKTAIMAVYCKSGHRSALSIPVLHAMGYTNAVSMSGGYEGWVAQGYPVEGAAQ